MRNRRTPLGVGEEQERNAIGFRAGRRQKSDAANENGRVSQMDRTTTLERRATAERAHKGAGRSWQGRRVAQVLQLLGALLVVSSVIIGVFASHAGAAGLSNGVVTLQTSNGSTATNPLANNQVVDVSVGPNSTLSQKSLEAAGFPSGVVGMKVLECEDPGGQEENLPQQLSSCEPSTLDNGPQPQSDGSVSVEGFTVYTVPNVAVLGASNGTMCDTQHECVIGIFSNQEDFSKPHLFSAPFATTGGTGAPSTSSSASPGSQTTSAGATPGVSVPPATLANTGAPTLWPWLLGGGFILLLLGSGLRYVRRPKYEGRS